MYRSTWILADLAAPGGLGIARFWLISSGPTGDRTRDLRIKNRAQEIPNAPEPEIRLDCESGDDPKAPETPPVGQDLATISGAPEEPDGGGEGSPESAAPVERDPVELSLAEALRSAAAAGQWRTVEILAGELAARRKSD